MHIYTVFQTPHLMIYVSVNIEYNKYCRVVLSATQFTSKMENGSQTFKKNRGYEPSPTLGNLVLVGSRLAMFV